MAETLRPSRDDKRLIHCTTHQIRHGGGRLNECVFNKNEGNGDDDAPKKRTDNNAGRFV